MALEGFNIVVDDVIVTESKAYGEDDVFLFEGGSLVNNTGHVITLTGKNTKIIAPPYQIFKGGFNFEGTWVMDRAYPQWFGAKAYASASDAKRADSTSSTDAINKAIKLKNVGEVFIPSGHYRITNTPNSDIFGDNASVYAGINITPGIQLVGEYGGKKIIANGSKTEIEFRTILHIVFDADKISKEHPENPSNYAVLIGINQSTASDDIPSGAGVTAPGMGHIMRGIYFRNGNNEKTLRGVLAGCGATFDSVIWENFIQAVKYTNDYIDGKKIVNCTFDFQEPFPDMAETSKPYAFDMGSSGDALLFEHNQINNPRNNIKALRLNQCGGGSINANVINADVLINACKGINFTSNHLERGAMLEIRQSNVTTSNNYFWHGRRPSVLICGNEYRDKSVVSLNGDAFTFCDNLSVPEELYSPVCEYDLAIDKYAILRNCLNFIQK